MEYLKIIVTIVLASSGWVAAHHFNSNRDLENRKKEIILPFLIQNYQVLSHDISKRNLNDERLEKLEKMISDLQLFGSPKQAKLARDLAEEISKGKESNLDSLINNLRNELRKELNLSEINENVLWLRKK